MYEGGSATDYIFKNFLKYTLEDQDFGKTTGVSTFGSSIECLDNTSNATLTAHL